MKTRAKAYMKQERRGMVFVIALCALAMTPFIGTIEGHLFPAASPMALERVEQGSTGTDTAIYGTSARLRPYCNFERIEWRLGERDGRSVLVSTRLGPPKVRDDGEFSFGPWYIGLSPPSKVVNGTFSDVYHQCGVKIGGSRIDFPWLTKSRFFN